MEIKLWGTRGSMPSPKSPSEMEGKIQSLLNDFVLFNKNKQTNQIKRFLKQLPRHQFGGWGGETSCYQVNHKDTTIIIDAGSGIRRLGYELMAGPCGKGQGEVHIYFTHFHWDHILGLLFFIPLFIPGNKIHLYAVQEDLEHCIKTLFRKPFFPVPFEALGSTIKFHKLKSRKKINHKDLQITPYLLDHPDPCWGYQIVADGKTYSHCVDTECTRISQKELGKDLPLYQNVDLLIFDAQYTMRELTEKIDWGHSTSTIALDIAIREGIKKIIFVHHDPASPDEKINQSIEDTVNYINYIKKHSSHNIDVKWEFGYDGMIIKL